MPRAGKRYPLVLYTRMMDRWWPPVFWIGVTMLVLAWWLHQDLYVRLTRAWQWQVMAGVGGLCLLAALLMLILRKSAYVRPYGDHLLVATPFLRMNISYRRIRQTSTATMGMLFPTARMSFLRRDTLEPLLRMTAVIVELNSLPIGRRTLRLFLSPFFFRDNTPHIVLLVRNWMGFSTELESLRAGGGEPAPAARRPRVSILSELSRK